MPEVKYRNYRLAGPARVKIYSQHEMATALNLTETRLIGALGQGIGLCYHAHPDATGEGYWFNKTAYQANIKVWICYRDGGHQMKSNAKYNYLPRGADTCQRCGHTNFK